MLKTRHVVAGAALVGAGIVAVAGTASAHPVPGGMSFGLYSGWFTLEDQKLRDLASAANQTQAAEGAGAADCVDGMAGEFPCELLGGVRDARGETFEHGDEALSVRFAGGEEAEHAAHHRDRPRAARRRSGRRER